MRALACILALVAGVAQASVIRGGDLSGGRVGGFSRAFGGVADRARGGDVPVLDFLVDGAAGWPTRQDFCTSAVAAGLLSGDAFCMNGSATVTSTGTATTFSTAGTNPPTTSTIPVCSESGAGCASVTTQYFNATTAQTGYLVSDSRSFPAGDFSMCFFGAMGETSQAPWIVSVWQGTAHFRLWYANGGVRLAIFNGTAETSTAAGAMTEKAWSVVCATYDRVADGTSVGRVYVDSGTALQTNSTMGAMQAATGSMFLGARDNAITSANMRGRLRGVLYTQRVLTGTEIGNLATAVHGTLAGSRGEAISFTRATASGCPAADFATTTIMPSGRPCVTTRGLLDESSTTNQMRDTEERSKSTWANYNHASLTFTENDPSVTAPDHQSNAERVVATSTPGNLYQLVNVTSMSKLAVSDFVRGSSTASSYKLGVDIANGINPTCACWRSDGGACVATVDGTRGCGCTMTPINETWVRFACMASLPSPYTGALYPLWQPVGAADFWVWGMQAETGRDMPSSYVRSGTAATARNGVNANAVTPSALVSGNEGCVKAEIWKIEPSISSSDRIISFAPFGRSPLVAQAATQTGFFDGTNNYYLSHPGSTHLRTALSVFAGWRGSDQTGYVGAAGAFCSTGCTNAGGTAGAYTTTQFTGSPMYIGSNVGASGYVNGFIKNVRIYSRKDACK